MKINSFHTETEGEDFLKGISWRLEEWGGILPVFPMLKAGNASFTCESRGIPVPAKRIEVLQVAQSFSLHYIDYKDGVSSLVTKFAM